MRSTQAKTKAKRGRPKNTTRAAAQKGDAVNLLKADHRKVEQLFKDFEKAEGSAEKKRLSQQICQELITHTLLEEEIFYPACRESDVEEDLLNEAQVEHDGAKALISDLLSQDPDEEFYDAKVKVLAEYIKHHVGEEEKPRSGIFASAQKAGVDMNALGQRLQERKKEIQEEAEAEGLSAPQPRSLHTTTSQYNRKERIMPRYSSNDRDRDEQGRFTSDDDNGRSRGRYGRGQDRDRDEYGRFMSDDDNGGGRSRGYSSRSRSRDDDDDDGGRGRGGWFGDSEGHSEASRRGWEERGSSSRSRSSRDDDDDYERGGRGRSQSRSSSRSRDDDRGHGGWFGDSEGHSEASRRGWEERGSSSRSRSSRDDDDDYERGGRGRSQSRSSSRSRDDDRGHGGWFGDPEGHSEASRRGWQHRD